VLAPAVTRALVDDFLARRSSRPRSAPPAVTPRERDVLGGVCGGLSNREIARDLYIGEATVKTYVSRLLDKFAAASRVGLVIAAIESGVLHAPNRSSPAPG